MELKEILFIGLVWPEAKSSAAGVRMLQLIDFFNAWGANITFASAAKQGKHPSDLSGLGVKSIPIALNDSSFDDFIRRLNPDIVVFDRFMTEEQFGWRVAKQCPDCIRILDTEDLHFLRAVRQECIKKAIELTDDLLLESALAKRELASVFRSDLSLVISDYEIRLLERVFKVSPDLLCYLPLTVDKVSESVIGWESKKDFVFIGNFIHAPNWDAVLNLKNNIWPQIRPNLPGVNLHIYGAYASDKVFQLHNDREGFLVHGWVEDAGAVIGASRVCLAPLRFGAGLKGKLLEAMNFGTPSVTTSIGAEGIGSDSLWPGCIEDDQDLFSKAAIQLYTDKLLWETSRAKGYALLKEGFDKQNYFKVFKETLESVSHNLSNRRIENFIGSMLMQHTTASSMYMAKWIEEKNIKTNSP